MTSETPVNSNAGQAFCTNCGTPHLIGANFCSVCGNRLSPQTTASAQPQPTPQQVKEATTIVAPQGEKPTSYCVQCVRCRTSFGLKPCSNCGDVSFEPNDSPVGFTCSKCRLTVEQWQCPSCNTKNPALKTFWSWAQPQHIGGATLPDEVLYCIVGAIDRHSSWLLADTECLFTVTDKRIVFRSSSKPKRNWQALQHEIQDASPYGVTPVHVTDIAVVLSSGKRHEIGLDVGLLSYVLPLVQLTMNK
jgi:hypothetical protein